MTWLRELLDRANAENMCVSYRCTTCGAAEFRDALWSGARYDFPRDITARGWTDGTLKALAAALANHEPLISSDHEPVRFMIMHLYGMVGEQAFTDEYAPGFSGSPANGVLQNMRRHHAARLESRKEHDRRNSEEGIAEARARRKAAGEQRATEHRARKAVRDANRPNHQ